MIALLPSLLFLIGIKFRTFFIVAIVVQGTYIVSRGLYLDRLPLVGLHDTLIFLSFSTAVFALPFVNRIRESGLFLKTISAIAMLFNLAGALAHRTNAPLPPVLRTFWFELHVVLSFLSYGLFGIAAVLGLIYFKQLREKALANETTVESLQYRAILIGYLFFSLSMIFGGIWAYLAWGTYWLWTPKELWTTLLWLTYTLYLHLRFRPWWRGWRIVSVGIAGYAVVLFTYLGVGLLMKSSHSF